MIPTRVVQKNVGSGGNFIPGEEDMLHVDTRIVVSSATRRRPGAAKSTSPDDYVSVFSVRMGHGDGGGSQKYS